MSTSVVQKILAIKSLGSIIYYAGRLVPYILVSAAFTFIYIFLPNIKVRFTSALTGGLFSGVMWKVTGMVFTSLSFHLPIFSYRFRFSIMVLFSSGCTGAGSYVCHAKVFTTSNTPGLYARKDSLSLSTE
jgi:membrane protein